MSKRLKITNNFYIYTQKNEDEDERITKSTTSTQTQTEQQAKKIFEERDRTPTIINTKTDVCSYKTNFKRNFKEWKKDNVWTPFLHNFTKHELSNMGYDSNVIYSINFLKTEIEFLKSKALQCPICYTYPEHPIMWKCGHCACETCNSKIDTCPVCRDPITGDIKLFC